MKSARAKPNCLHRWPLTARGGEGPSVARRVPRASPMALAVPLANSGRRARSARARRAASIGVVLLVGLGWSRSRSCFRLRPRESAAGWILVDPNGIARHRSAGDSRLVFWAERFGLVVLSNESKTRGLLAITTPEQTRYVPVRVHGEGEDAVAALRALCARAVARRWRRRPRAARRRRSALGRGRPRARRRRSGARRGGDRSHPPL